MDQINALIKLYGLTIKQFRKDPVMMEPHRAVKTTMSSLYDDLDDSVSLQDLWDANIKNLNSNEILSDYGSESVGISIHLYTSLITIH